MALFLSAAASLSCLLTPSWAEERERPQQETVSEPAPGDAKITGHEGFDQIPEGEPLPDMPDGDSGASSRAGPGQVRAGTTGAPADYVIGPEDVLQIDVFNVPELKRTVRVSNDGMVGLTLIGRVRAAGLTVDQLREQLEAQYGESYLQDPQIQVFVAEYRAQSVSVIGAVERPGMYQLTAPRTLIEILSMAGGLAKRTSASAGRTLVVTRKGGFGDLPMVEGMRLLSDDRLEIEIRPLLYSQESGLNIDVKPFDTISVARADLVYVVGDVKKPTGILMEDQDDLTVLQAIAVAEGLNRTASRKKARILRRNEDGSKTEIPVNLSDILSGKAPDLTLAANDVLFVPDSRGKVMMQRGLEATIATVSGVIIWSSR
jgi:polysaccharide export outer membrane protein